MTNNSHGRMFMKRFFSRFSLRSPALHVASLFISINSFIPTRSKHWWGQHSQPLVTELRCEESPPPVQWLRLLFNQGNSDDTKQFELCHVPVSLIIFVMLALVLDVEGSFECCLCIMVDRPVAMPYLHVVRICHAWLTHTLSMAQCFSVINFQSTDTQPDTASRPCWHVPKALVRLSLSLYPPIHDVPVVTGVWRIRDPLISIPTLPFTWLE